MSYAGFWRRLFAFAIDAILLLPLIYLANYLSSKTQWYFALWLIPGTAFGLWFSVYLVHRYGGTPGKLLANIRIRMLDGSPVTKKAALVRYSVIFLLSIVQSVILAIAAIDVPDAVYFSGGFIKRMEAVIAAGGPICKWLETVLQLWIWGEFVVMLFNSKRRAAHDFMAGTVVVDLRKHV